MLVVSEDRGSILSYHNERDNYEAKIIESKNIKITGIVIAITGLLVGFLGLLLFILCGSIPPAVTVPLFVVGMIMLICGAVLSLVFSCRRTTLHKARLLLEVQVQMESLLDCLEKGLVDLRSESETLFMDSSRCKEELECLANTFAKGITDSHRKLSEQFHQAVETGMFRQKKTDLKQELESLQDKFELYSEAVLLNRQLHDHIKSGEDFCLKFDSFGDIVASAGLRELQEEALALSKTILKEEDPNPSAVAGYKKDLEKLLMSERSIYNGMTDTMRLMKDSGMSEDWNTFKKRCHAVIKKAMLLIDGLSRRRLIVLRDRIHNELEAGFNTSAEFMVNFIQDKLENLLRLRKDIHRASKAILEGFPLERSLSVIDTLFSVTVSLDTVMEKIREANSSEGLEQRIAKKVAGLTLDALAVFKESDRGGMSPSVFFQQALNNKWELLESQASNYASLLNRLSPLIIDIGDLIEKVDPDGRDVLIQKLHTQSDCIARDHGISLTEEMQSFRTEEVLFKKVLFLLKKFSDDQECYWCNKGLYDNVMKLLARFDSEFLEEETVVLDDFMKEIIQKEKYLPTDEKYLANLTYEKRLIAEWSEISHMISEQINIFSEVSPLLKEQYELQRFLKKNNLPQEDKEAIQCRCTAIHMQLEAKKAACPSLFHKQLFEEFQDQNNRRGWCDVMEKVKQYYNEAQDCFGMLRLRGTAESILSLFNIIYTVEESPLSKEECLAVLEELRNVIVESKELEQSLTTLNAQELLKESGDLRCVMKKLKSTFQKVLKTTESSESSESSESAEDCVLVV